MLGGQQAEPPSVESVLTFAEVEAQVDYFPYHLKLVVHAPYGACGHGVECNFRRAYLVVTGDGELPEYRVFDIGAAQRWDLVEWHDPPSIFHDDERDVFRVTMRRVLAPDDQVDYVTASISLYSDHADLTVESGPE